ncbi:MAG TPA: LPS export ABC transporter periplasmic protein LptC [Desulfotignum sp.]|nr:LPS export ABC transporter periplasmic protein LptC [Desulfotignum sp.]
MGQSVEALSLMTLFAGKKLIIPFLLLLAFMVLVPIGFFFINRTVFTPPTITDLHIDSEAALKLNLMKQVSKRNGVTEWELEAATATLIKDQEQAVLTDVRVIFYTDENDRVYLTSDQGVLNTRTHDIVFSGSVVVRHQAYTLKTDKLHYEKKPHIIPSETRVWLESNDSTMEADTMETRLKENKVFLQGHVKGTFSEDINLL